jgi:hypothetical protein
MKKSCCDSCKDDDPCGCKGGCADAVENGTCGCSGPVRLPDLHLTTFPGGVLRLEYLVDNFFTVDRNFFLAATGSDASAVYGAPPSLTIGPFETGRLTAVFVAPLPPGKDPDCAPAHEMDFVLWLRGCRDHVQRVSVCVRGKGLFDSTVCRRIIERPDCEHTWHDHFATYRPCPV